MNNSQLNQWVRNNSGATKYSIQFASEKVADYFSYERTVPDMPTFGFHGLFNMWRHCTDDEMIKIIKNLTPHTINSREFTELTLTYFQFRKFDVLQEISSVPTLSHQGCVS